MKYYMGIDIGTSGCKAIVFDEHGLQVASAYREYNPISPEYGWAELDPDEVMDKCFAVIAETTSNTPGKSICGLGISSQGEAFTPVDRNGNALSNALISSDIRAKDYATEWSRKFGIKKLYQITGHTAHPMFSLFKLLWLKENRPDIWSNTSRFLCFEDLLQYRLGLDPAMGWPLAGRTMFFDVRRHKWSPEILQAIDLPEEKLSRPLPSGTIAGKIKSDIARELGLVDSVFVVTGGHDQTCGALGAGVTEPGLAMYATGTVECITPAFSSAIFTEELRKNNLCTYDHTVPGMYSTVAFSLTGGNILKWFRDEFGAAEISEAKKSGVNSYELLLKEAGDKPSPLLVLPYFTPSGTPYFDTKVPGCILGLRLLTKKGEMIRGLLEGVAFEMRLNLDILERSGYKIRELRTIGGGAKSEIWNQLKADVIGKSISVLKVTEAGCLGTAMLAKAAETQESVANIAAQWVKPVKIKEPRTDFSTWYSERFLIYRQLYPKLKNISI